jgi:hypothetical protein
MGMKFIGGPLDGQESEYSIRDAYEMAHSKDRQMVLLSNGETATLFGRHRYDRASYAQKTGDSTEYVDQWEYVGYTPPVIPHGSIVIDLSGKEVK